MEITDEELMLILKSGDNYAFDSLYQRHDDHLYRYLLRKCGDKTIAEDLSQDIWLKLFNTRERYNVYAKFIHYLFKIAHNHFIDYCRRNKNNPVIMDIDAIADLIPGDDAEEPSIKVEGEDGYKAILQFVYQLPDEQREVFLLKEVSGLNVTEIADITGASKETVKSRYRYAVDKLKSSMSGYE